MTNIYISGKPDLFFDRADAASLIGSALYKRVGHGREWSVEEVALRLGRSVSAVKLWRAGSEPPPADVLLNMIRLFDDKFTAEITREVGYGIAPFEGAACVEIVHATALDMNHEIALAKQDNHIDHNEALRIDDKALHTHTVLGGYLNSRAA